VEDVWGEWVAKQLFGLFELEQRNRLAKRLGLASQFSNTYDDFLYRWLVRLACRLEEYRIAHGTYADRLDELPDLPAHLNQEVLSEEPLRYQRKGDGYQLYSVGWGQKDDGGVFNNDDRFGDWPWPRP
jgi:hypothetical protein